MNSQTTTNVTAFPDRTRIKEEAARWFVRLETGPLDEEEMCALREWAQQSEFHRNYFLQLAATWDDMAALGELSKIFPLAENEQVTESSPAVRNCGLWRYSRYFFSGSAMAALGIVCVSLAVLLLVQSRMFESPQQEVYATGFGERDTFSLSDGSVVSLNTDSEIILDFSDTRRAVTLTKGEASFQVSKNPERPFGVYAGSGMVWAVGTAFNVRYSSSSVDVTVTEGSVKVFSDIQTTTEESLALEDAFSSGTVDVDSTDTGEGHRSEALLKAGDVIRYSQVIESLESVEEEEIQRKLAWHNGALVFKGESLEQAVQEISRYTDRKIIIVDPFLADLRVGGHYKVDDINALLASLGQGLNINVEHRRGQIFLSAIE